ncbi:MAG: hypothetical protein U1F41_16380 [Burkholderiales bacterium]
MNAAIAARVTVPVGQYSRWFASITWHPSEMPFCAIHVMYPQNGSDAATSSNTHGDTPGQNCAQTCWGPAAIHAKTMTGKSLRI